jgi:hypothetical protein
LNAALKFERLERPPVSHYHLDSLEHAEMIVSLWIYISEGCRRVGSENDFDRLAAKRYQNSNVWLQTVDHIAAACYYVINLIPWRLELARWRLKRLTISVRRKEQSVRAGLSPTVESDDTIRYCRQNITQDTPGNRAGHTGGWVTTRLGDKSGRYRKFIR